MSVRNVVLSTLLGTTPPALPLKKLALACELFGFTNGATRTSINRSVQRGELEALGNSWYGLGQELAQRQKRQHQSVRTTSEPWDGTWRTFIAHGDSRDANTRRELRDAMYHLRFANLRDGVWVRPNNLELDPFTPAEQCARKQCVHIAGTLTHGESDTVANLWPLQEFESHAFELKKQLVELGRTRLPHRNHGHNETFDDQQRFSQQRFSQQRFLRQGFVLSASVFRHLQKDPLLPKELRPNSRHGDSLRSTFAQFDTMYRHELSAYFDAHVASTEVEQ